MDFINGNKPQLTAEQVQAKYQLAKQYSQSLSPSEFVDEMLRIKQTNPKQFDKQVVDFKNELRKDLMQELDQLAPNWRNKNIKSLLRLDDKNPSFSISASSNDGQPDIVFNDFALGESGQGVGVVRLFYMRQYQQQPSNEQLDEFILNEGASRGYERIGISLNNFSVEQSGEVKRTHSDPNKSLPQKRAFLLQFLADNDILQIDGNKAKVDINQLKTAFNVAPQDKVTLKEWQDLLNKQFNQLLSNHDVFSLELNATKKNGSPDTYTRRLANEYNTTLVENLTNAVLTNAKEQSTLYLDRIAKTSRPNEPTQVVLNNIYEPNRGELALPICEDEKANLLIDTRFELSRKTAQVVRTQENGKDETISLNLMQTEAKNTGHRPRAILTTNSELYEQLKEQGIQSVLMAEKYYRVPAKMNDKVEPRSAFNFFNNRNVNGSVSLEQATKLDSIKAFDHPDLVNSLQMKRLMTQLYNLNVDELCIDLNSFATAKTNEQGQHYRAVNSDELAKTVACAIYAQKGKYSLVHIFDPNSNKQMDLSEFSSLYFPKQTQFLDKVLDYATALHQLNTKLNKAQSTLEAENDFRNTQKINRIKFDPAIEKAMNNEALANLRLLREFNNQYKTSLSDEKTQIRKQMNEVMSPHETQSIHLDVKHSLNPVVVKKIEDVNTPFSIWLQNQINNKLVEKLQSSASQQSQEFQAFIKSRGLDVKDQNGTPLYEKFGLGFYAGESHQPSNVYGNLLSELRRDENLKYKGVSINEALKGENIALYKCIADDRTNMYGTSFKRIVFPVQDAAGNVIAFGGRKIDGVTPESPDKPVGKYINSGYGSKIQDADTYRSYYDKREIYNQNVDDMQTLFNKDKTYYGLYQSLAGIANKQSAVITEGFMDCISSHKFGFDNVVATNGTSLSTTKLNELYNYTNDITLMQDGDLAGLTSMVGVLKRVLDEKNNPPVIEPYRQLKFVGLPLNLDPDEFVNEYGAKAYQAQLDNAMSIPEFAVKAAFFQTFEQEGFHAQALTSERINERKYDLGLIARFEQTLQGYFENFNLDESANANEREQYKALIKEQALSLGNQVKSQLINILSVAHTMHRAPQDIEQVAFSRVADKNIQANLVDRLVFSEHVKMATENQLLAEKTNKVEADRKQQQVQQIAQDKLREASKQFEQSANIAPTHQIHQQAMAVKMRMGS